MQGRALTHCLKIYTDYIVSGTSSGEKGRAGAGYTGSFLDPACLLDLSPTFSIIIKLHSN